jgi:hypothetical protein
MNFAPWAIFPHRGCQWRRRQHLRGKAYREFQDSSSRPAKGIRLTQLMNMQKFASEAYRVMLHHPVPYHEAIERQAEN